MLPFAGPVLEKGYQYVLEDWREYSDISKNAVLRDSHRCTAQIIVVPPVVLQRL